MSRNTSIFLLLCLITIRESGLGADDPELLVSAEPLRQISAVRALRYRQAKEGPPVKLRVTVISHLYSGFDAQDQTGGLFFKSDQKPAIGTRLEISGNVTGGHYGPYILPDEITPLGEGRMPRPLRWLPEFAQTGAGDNRWLEIEGLLAGISISKNGHFAKGTLVTGPTELGIRFISYDLGFQVERMRSLKGAWVRLRGSGAPLFNDDKQRIGSEIICSSMDFVEVVDGADLEALPLTPLNELRRWDNRRERLGLSRSRGNITLIDGDQIIVQSGKHAAPVMVRNFNGATIGDRVEILGIPGSFGFRVGLRFADLKKVASDATDEIQPQPDSNTLSRDHAFKLIRVIGDLVEERPGFLTLQVGDQLVPVRSLADPPAIGSELKVTGVKVVDTNERGEVRSVEIAPRDQDDIYILSAPPWWTPARYLTTVLVLASVILGVLAWTILLRRRVHAQTVRIKKQIEQNATLEERTRIARELHDTLSQGFAGVGYQLKSVTNHLTRNPHKAGQKLELARRMVDHSLQEARYALTALRTPEEPGRNFVESFESSSEALCESACLPFQCHVQGESFDLEKEQAREAQRILLEAVSNAIKHADPTKINATLARSGNKLTAVIDDDGCGFDLEGLNGSTDRFGIPGMRERAARLGGELDIASEPGKGTQVTLKFSPSFAS